MNPKKNEGSKRNKVLVLILLTLLIQIAFASAFFFSQLESTEIGWFLAEIFKHPKIIFTFFVSFGVTFLAISAMPIPKLTLVVLGPQEVAVTVSPGGGLGMPIYSGALLVPPWFMAVIAKTNWSDLNNLDVPINVALGQGSYTIATMRVDGLWRVKSAEAFFKIKLSGRTLQSWLEDQIVNQIQRAAGELLATEGFDLFGNGANEILVQRVNKLLAEFAGKYALEAKLEGGSIDIPKVLVEATTVRQTAQAQADAMIAKAQAEGEAAIIRAKKEAEALRVATKDFTPEQLEFEVRRMIASNPGMASVLQAFLAAAQGLKIGGLK